MLGHKQSPETRAKIAESNRNRVYSDETRAKISASVRAYYQNHPEAREILASQMRGKKQSSDTCEKKSKSHLGKKLSEKHKSNIREALSNPEVRKKISDSIRGENNPNYGKTTPLAVRMKISATERGKIISVEDREKKRLAMYNPDGTSKRAGKNHPLWGKHPSKETREKLSESHRGEKCHLWRGGISFEPYCPKFNRSLKEYIRDTFDRRCVICGSVDNGKKHHIHHIDYNKLQGCKGVTWALVPLCHSCHAKTNFNRWYWFNLLINYWALNPDINFSEDFDDKRFGENAFGRVSMATKERG